MQEKFNNLPIGVFDSGIGGLTVVKSIMQAMPNENIIYFGDIARIPYGTKSVPTIRKFAEQTVNFLLKQNVKAIVIACNTISSVATERVRELACDIPIIDVISAGSKASSAIGNRIGVIATPATIKSNAYPTMIKQFKPHAMVYTKACSLFVPFIEEGIIDHPALDLIAQDYLQELIKDKVDTLILGCTHYPLIKNTIARIMGEDVHIIDPALTAASDLKDILTQNCALNMQKGITPSYKFFVTDIPLNFQKIGENFLNASMTQLEVVNLD